MFYTYENGKIRPADPGEAAPGEQRVGFLGYEEAEEMLPKLGLGTKPLEYSVTSRSMIFENHDGFDFVCLNVLDRERFKMSDRVCVYVRENMLLFISRGGYPDESLLRDENTAVSFDRVLSNFFERLILENVALLESIEQEIADLENALITSGKRNCVREIISLRKRLMVLKQYYEQLLNVLDELEENENGFLPGAALRYFAIYAGKVDRLYHNVLNLRDYVTQVRESYQAEVDISLNNVMKLFTVITAIFLPLTLIVGWYGMNFQMPEYRWPYGYQMVIVISAVVVVFCVNYFKRKRWF